jgi:hypothetical protein
MSRHAAERFNLIALPRAIAPQFARHKSCHVRGHRHRGLGIEEQDARSSRQHILHRTRHFLSHRPNDLGGIDGKFFVELLCHARVLIRHIQNRRGIGAVNLEVAELRPCGVRNALPSL